MNRATAGIERVTRPIAASAGLPGGPPDRLASTPLAILILARDEADLLEATLASIKESLSPGDRLHVVADHCRDETAAVARRSGAILHVRQARHGEAGKGAALRWWLAQTAAGKDGSLPVVVLDADSLPGPGFLDAIRLRMARGEQAVQAFLEPRLQAGSPFGLLAAYSEIVEQRVFDAARARLGWPVRLRGTGMAFARTMLEKAGRRLHTTVEDVELTLLLGAWGIPISLARETYVVDPKPADEAGAIRQRARWLRGQFEALQACKRELVLLAFRGPSGWSLLSSVLLKPKALFLPLQTLLGAVSAGLWVSTGAPGWLGLSLWLLISLVFDAAGLVWGLRLLTDKEERVRVFAASPSYLWMWLRSLGLSLVTRERWLRSRPTSASVRPSELTGET